LPVVRTLLVLSLAVLPSCFLATRSVALRPDAVLTAGSDVEVKVEVPGDWFAVYPAAPGESALGYLAPDNYSGLALWVARGGIPAKHCPRLARTAALDATAAAMVNANLITMSSRPILFDQYVWARLRRPSAPITAQGTPEIVVDPAAPEIVNYRFDRITPAGFTPGPNDRFVQGRVLCRHGVLAVVSCTTGVDRRETIGADCSRAVASLTVEPFVREASYAVAPAPAAGNEAPAAPGPSAAPPPTVPPSEPLPVLAPEAPSEPRPAPQD